jgi:hypothetical protein
MATVKCDPAKPPDREALRRELLRLIVKREAGRRASNQAPEK